MMRHLANVHVSLVSVFEDGQTISMNLDSPTTFTAWRKLIDIFIIKTTKDKI